MASAAAAAGHGPKGALSEYLRLTTRTGLKPIHRVAMDNWQPATTVAMVSVPLSISLGIASVATDDPAAPAMGVATAIWGGLVAGIFGSSDMNIVGPAGALSGMLSAYTIQFNGAGVLPYISLLSACVIFVVYVLNLQRYFLLMPTAVFEGFTLAVALIIGLNQLNMAFDLHPPGAKHEHFYENVIESLKVLDQASLAPSIFFFIVTALLLGLVKYVPKVKGHPVPWTVIVPLVTIVFGYLSATDNLGGIAIPTLKNKYGELHARVVVPPTQPLSYYAQGKIGGIITASFGVAFVAVLETLISARIAEQKTNWGFDDSRETFGLMICHVVCGAVGAMPPTGVFVRTALNFSLGCTHKMSQVMNALVVLLIAVVAMPVFSYLPQCSVASLLIFASVRMAPITYATDLWKTDKGSFGLLIFTCLVCVFSDPVYGLIVGMVIGLLRDAAVTARAESRVTVLEQDKSSQMASGDEHPGADPPRPSSSGSRAQEVDGYEAKLAARESPISSLLSLVMTRSGKRENSGSAKEDANPYNMVNGQVVVYEPMGPIVYLSKDKHAARLKLVIERRPAAVMLSLDLATHTDKDGSDSLGKVVKQLEQEKIAVKLCLPPGLEESVLGRSAWVAALREGGHVHAVRADALSAAQSAEAADSPASGKVALVV